MTTLQEDQIKAGNQGRPGYDTLGNKVETPTPTVVSGATGRYPSDSPTPKSATQVQEDKITAGAQAEDPTAVASRIQGEYAAELASIKNYYAGLTSHQLDTNKVESGRTRALVSASGELGQDIGNAQQDNQDTSNQDKLDIIAREGAAAEGALYSKQNTTIESEIQSEKQKQQESDVQRLGFLSDEAQKAQAQVASVAGSTDLATLPQNEYDSLYEASGFATPEQFNTYYNAMRQSALTGGKTIGDATTGVYQQKQDGTWSKVIPGAKTTIGDPTAGVWQKQDDGTYKNIIPAQPKTGSIGAQGSFIFDPTTGSIKTIKPAAPKIVSSGGVIYSVDPSTQKATQLTTTQQGWTGAKGVGGDQEKAAVLSYINGLGLADEETKALTEAVQTNPQAYYATLGNASQEGYYTPMTVSAGTPQDNTDANINSSINSSGSDTSQ